ncbi:MAG: hypothetical protein ABMA14_13815, partial [Hyphomonadaceae bacterium]
MLGIVAGVAVAVASIARDPGIGGILGGVFGGVVLALVITVAGAWAAMSLMHGPKTPDTVGGEAIEGELKDVLAELESARLEIVEKINRRALWRVPLCAAAGVALLIASQFSDDPPDVVEMVSLVAVPSLAGYIWASLDLSSRYARLYKEKVLPRLASSFGALSYRAAILPDIARL